MWRRRRTSLVLAALAALALAGIVLAVLAERGVQAERSSRRTEVEGLQAQLGRARHRLAALRSENAVLAKRLEDTRRSIGTPEAGLAPLAARIRRSVFVVDTPGGFGTGWAAWRAGGATYLITANHVVQDAIARGTHDVRINQNFRTWPGVIVATDSGNDLAVVRVLHLNAPPLWQTPGRRPVPVGDRVILVGSPFGLEGTVTAGVVSRIGAEQIVTDAASDPGNSGGPAVDSSGQVVGVLLSDLGGNLSLLVPIQRACVTIRRCG
jgi:S1-C subfamily serine protease